jgi:hypothetical protein
MNPPFHPPSVCPSANLSSFTYLIQKLANGAPTLHQCFMTILPSLGHHLTLGHPFLYLYISPQNYLLFIIYCTNTFTFSQYILCRHRWRLAFFLAIRNPCHPWIGAILIIYPCRHRPYLQSNPQVSYPYPLNLFTLSRLWHNLAPVLSSP